MAQVVTNLVPFGLRGGRIYAVEEVSRGIKCQCVCPDPLCGKHLVARQGTDKVWHFAHAGDQDGSLCGGGESGLHKYAKQVLCESTGAIFALPQRTNKEFYNGHDGALRISGARPEFLIPGTSRRCDVLLDGQVRPAVPRGTGWHGKGWKEWSGQEKVAVEIAVTNYKNEAYFDEIRQAGTLSVLEISLSWKYVWSESERLHKPYRDVVHHVLLRQTDIKKWIFKLGSAAWVCPFCGGFRHRDMKMCYSCGHDRAECPSCGRAWQISSKSVRCYACIRKPSPH